MHRRVRDGYRGSAPKGRIVVPTSKGANVNPTNDMQFLLRRNRSRPGDIVQRFGAWQKDGSTLLMTNTQWLSFGKPDEITITVQDPTLTRRERRLDEDRAASMEAGD